MRTTVDPQRLDAVLAEYNSLRAEILHADRVALGVMGIALSSTTLIASYAIANSSPFVFLVPLPVLWMALRYIATKRWDIYTIGSYIRCRIENTGIGLGWETAVAEAKGSAVGHRLRISRITSCEFWLLTLMGLVLVVLFEGYYEHPALYWPRSVPIVGYAFYLFTSVRTYRKLWRERETRSLDAMWSKQSA